MIQINLNGQPARVRNIDSIGFRTSFVDNYAELELNVDTLTLVNESRDFIYDWIFGSGAGAFVAIPIEITYGTLTTEYIIDLSQNVRINEHEAEVRIRKRKGTDSFFDYANGASFEYLRARVVNFLTINVPYVIIPDNQFETALTLGLAIFSMTQATLQAVRDLGFLAQELASAVANPVTANIAIGVSLKFVTQLAYTTALVLALIDLTNQFREIVFPKLRYFKACRVKSLIQQACEFQGYTFESTLLDAFPELTILPVPIQKNNKSIFNFKQEELTESFTKGYPTSLDTVPTLGDLISAIEVMYNATTKVTNGVVRLEQDSYWQGLANTNSAPALNIQDKRIDEFTLNTDEAWIRYYLHYQTDFSDLHTLDKFDQTVCEYGNANTTAVQQDLSMLKNLRDASIPFSIGARKRDLNFIEKLAKLFFDVIDALTGLNTSALIENRIGVLQISNQFYSNTKLLFCTADGRQPANYLSKIGANYLFTTFHLSQEVPQLNGWLEYSDAPILLNFEQFEQILNNNYININNVLCEIRTIEFIPAQSKATITYRVPNNYSNGKISTFVVQN